MKQQKKINLLNKCLELEIPITSVLFTNGKLRAIIFKNDTGDYLANFKEVKQIVKDVSKLVKLNVFDMDWNDLINLELTIHGVNKYNFKAVNDNAIDTSEKSLYYWFQKLEDFEVTFTDHSGTVANEDISAP